MPSPPRAGPTPRPARTAPPCCTTDRRPTGASTTLDGSAGNVQAPDDATLDPSSKLTLEAWINPTSGQFVDNNFRYVIQKPYTAFISPYYQYGLGIADNSTYPKALTFSVTLGGTNASL